MVDISSAANTVIRRLAGVSEGSGIRMLTFKKDRSVTIVRIDAGTFRVIEQGFENREFVVEEKRLRKTVKNLLKREFPRSRKVRLSKVSLRNG